MPKISDAQRTARRTQILDAFRVCVAREGFHRTSMAEVIGEAGLSPGEIVGSLLRSALQVYGEDTPLIAVQVCSRGSAAA